MRASFPRLSVLERIIIEAGDAPLAGVALVGVQHLLETTGSMIEASMRLGLDPSKIFLLGKCYSTCPSVVADLQALGVTVIPGPMPLAHGQYKATMRQAVSELWDVALARLDLTAVRRLVVLDDGGQCITAAPPTQLQNGQMVVGVEQTTSGIKASAGLMLPIVDVASSAAKRILEPSMIASAVAIRVSQEIWSSTNRPIGVLGYGNIGQAIARLFTSAGREVVAFDLNPSIAVDDRRVDLARSAYEVLNMCDVVFGCAGEDVLPDISKLRELAGSKLLISCSSGDVEFNSILSLATGQPVLDAEGKIPVVNVDFPGGPQVEIVRGGFPANFDRTMESVPAEDIQLTRGLLLGGVLQAAKLPIGVSQSQPLDPYMQQRVVSSWTQDLRSAGPSSVSSFDDMTWIEGHSQFSAKKAGENGLP